MMTFTTQSRKFVEALFGASQYADAGTKRIVFDAMESARDGHKFLNPNNMKQIKTRSKGCNFNSNEFCFEKCLQSILSNVAPNKYPWVKAQDINLYVTAISSEALGEAISCALNYAGRIDYNHNKYGVGHDYFSRQREEEKALIASGTLPKDASAKAQANIIARYDSVATNGTSNSVLLDGRLEV